MANEYPEPGTRAKVQTDEGEEIAVHTGHMWASEDGSRIIDNVESWEEAPSESELTVTGAPETLPEPPTPEADEEE